MSFKKIPFFDFRLFLLLFYSLFFVSTAQALPLFAKKYNLPCTVCHEAFPKLNDFGTAFRDNGYQMKTGRDTPLENPVISPFSIRTTPFLTVQTQIAVPTDQNNSDTVTTGTFNLTSLDILSGGVLARNISYFVVITPFLDNTVDLESAWIRFSNLLDTPWLNIKLGKHELDIPFSQKRAFGLTQHGGDYLIYNYHPGGPANVNVFNLGNNQFGLELSGHSRGSRVRYTLDVNNGSQVARNQALGKRPNLFTQVSFGVDQKITSERFGFFADYGFWPTSFTSVNNINISGSGYNEKRFSRWGTDLIFNFGSSGTPQGSLLLQYLYGIDDGSLVGSSVIPDTVLTCVTLPTTPCNAVVPGSTGGSRDAVFQGGTIEINLMPNLRTLFFHHFDWIKNIQQADPGLPGDYFDQISFSTGLRYYLHQSIFDLVALHGEWTYFATTKTNLVTFNDQPTQIFLVGVDYAF